jgi:hypothetical protein
MVVLEAGIVVERLDREEATRALLVQMAVSSMLSKKAANAFQKTIKKMTQI